MPTIYGLAPTVLAVWKIFFLLIIHVFLKVKTGVCSSVWETHHEATERCMPHGITVHSTVE